jgi:acyl-coenzyme A thioesterase PaaI-like protein
MMGVADAAMYIAVLGSIGWGPLAVTTSFHINFRKKPPARALDAEGRLLKLGKWLAVGEIWVH